MKDEYRQLIVNVLKETQSITESSESPKEHFRKKILDNSLEYQQRKFITKKEFLTNCEEAVNQLKIFVKKGVKSEKYANTSKLFSLLGLNKSASPKNEDYYDAYVVTINSLFNTSYYLDGDTVIAIGMCFNDIKFIEDVFETIASIEPKLVEIETLDLSYKLLDKKIISENYAHIFSNNGFVLFEYILANFVAPKGEKGRMSDLIYFYWKMYDENKPSQYIHRKPTDFFIWFDKKYEDTFGQLKTLPFVTTANREKFYSLALDWFKSSNQ